MARRLHTKVVGVTFSNTKRSEGRRNRQRIIEDSQLNGGAYLELFREADNPHDKNAISVWFDKEKIGYLSAELVRDLAPLFDKGGKIAPLGCDITGGTHDRPTFGVNIELQVTPPSSGRHSRKRRLP